jgi:hypothetical protein
MQQLAVMAEAKGYLDPPFAQMAALATAIGNAMHSIRT